MSMTIDNDIQIIGHRDGRHVCPCGCGRMVSSERYFVPSDHPREDLTDTLEARIAEAVAVAQAKAEAKRPHFEQLLIDLRQIIEHELTPNPIITCPCCTVTFSPDEYRAHVVDDTDEAWCDRIRWGQSLGLER